MSNKKSEEFKSSHPQYGHHDIDFDLNLKTVLLLKKIDDDYRTSVMIKNIPNKYTKEMMLKTLNKSFKGKFDFFYLPIDFRVSINKVECYKKNNNRANDLYRYYFSIEMMTIKKRKY